MNQEAFCWAKERGYKIGLASVELLQVVKDKLETRKIRREIQSEFFNKYFSSFTYLKDGFIDKPGSIIIIARPRPAHTIDVEFMGKRKRFVFPPTYVKYKDVFNEVLVDFKHSLGIDKYQASLINAPLKSLAVHTGLAAYGKNNITYIPEFGSYFQLIGIVTNIPAEKKNGGQDGKEIMAERCQTCQACLQACPLQAISSERFLLFAEKCYVSYSESPEPFPSGMISPSPDCLIGCLKCQEVCPMNKGKLRYEDTGIYFTAAESEVIINNGTSSPRWKEIKGKLESLGLSEDYLIQLRNLRQLLSG
jgi:epoxyqueuosine reductase